MENIIDTYRKRMKGMGYEPRRQEDIPDVMAAYGEAIANCKIEGLELVSDDHSFCLLLVETQIPVDVAIGLAQDYNRDVLSRQTLAACLVSDPYTWRNSDVLRNKLGIRDDNILQEREAFFSVVRHCELIVQRAMPATYAPQSPELPLHQPGK